MPQTPTLPLRRRWPLILLAVAVVLAGLWSGLWYYAAGIAERTIAGWMAREVRAGRVYDCATRTIGGFPFNFEFRCSEAAAEVTSTRPPIAVKTRDLLISAQLWRPTVLTSEFTGPLTAGEPGQPASVTANWRHAQTRVLGLPTSPEKVSITLDEPVFKGGDGGRDEIKASRIELSGRMVSGTARQNPVIEAVLKLIAASAPRLHPAVATPVDADITAVLRGLKNFAPKPWPDRFRELQAAGGHIEVIHARVRQGETIATADGVLGLSASGRLDGQLRLTVANLEKLLPSLGLDRLLKPQAGPNKLNKAFGALDRIMPGLGNVARENAGPAIVAGITMMGQPTELEGQRAVILPLRIKDGAVSLGLILVGRIPPLF